MTILGKGNKERVVPVPIALASSLSKYLVARGLDVDPQAPVNAGAYLLGQATDVAERAPWSARAGLTVDPKAGISSSALYGQLKAFFTDCASALAATEPKEAERLVRASTHWLRHTHGSHAVVAGTPLDVIQQNMGHASLNTTTMYLTAEDRRKMQAMGKFWAMGEDRPASVPVPDATLAPEPASTGPEPGPDNVVHIKKLTLWLTVENNSKFTRGKKRAREEIESGCLSGTVRLTY